MRKLIVLLLIFCFSNLSASSIKLDSLLSLINDNNTDNIDNIEITDAIFLNNVSFCKLFNVNTNLKHVPDLIFEIYYKNSEVVKVVVRNKKLNVSEQFYVLKIEHLTILLAYNKTYFIIPQNDFFIFFNFFSENNNNKLSIDNIEQIVSVDSEFNPLTKIYINNNLILAYSNFNFEKKYLYEKITIYRQNLGRCIGLNDKKLNFILDFFREKGEFSCDGFFKRFNIKLESRYKIHYGLFWFLGSYQQYSDE